MCKRLAIRSFVDIHMNIHWTKP